MSCAFIEEKLRRRNELDPECYLLGKQRLKEITPVDGKFLVLEDAPAGVRAGK